MTGEVKTPQTITDDSAKHGKTTCYRCYDWVDYRSQMRASFRVQGRDNLEVCAAHLAWAVRELGPLVMVMLVMEDV